MREDVKEILFSEEQISDKVRNLQIELVVIIKIRTY